MILTISTTMMMTADRCKQANTARFIDLTHPLKPDHWRWRVTMKVVRDHQQGDDFRSTMLAFGGRAGKFNTTISLAGRENWRLKCSAVRQILQTLKALRGILGGVTGTSTPNRDA
jgi:hypothetical protein